MSLKDKLTSIFTLSSLTDVFLSRTIIHKQKKTPIEDDVNTLISNASIPISPPTLPTFT